MSAISTTIEDARMKTKVPSGLLAALSAAAIAKLSVRLSSRSEETGRGVVREVGIDSVVLWHRHEQHVVPLAGVDRLDGGTGGRVTLWVAT